MKLKELLLTTTVLACYAITPYHELQSHHIVQQPDLPAEATPHQTIVLQASAYLRTHSRDNQHLVALILV